MTRTADGIEIKTGMPAWLARDKDSPLLVMVAKVDADTVIVESGKLGRRRVGPDELYSRRERAPKVMTNGNKSNNWDVGPRK